jgi:hypothetical protein
LVLFDVTTLDFETDTGDGFREPGFSKERKLEPQITVGLLTDATGFPLMVNAFEGNKAETTTMLPTIEAFMAAPPPGCDRGGRRGDDLQGQPEGDRAPRVSTRNPPGAEAPLLHPIKGLSPPTTNDSTKTRRRRRRRP